MLNDQYLSFGLKNFTNEYLFQKLGEILNSPNIQNICFNGFFP